MIKLYWTNFEEPLDKEEIKEIVKRLPLNAINRLDDYYRWQDSTAHLLGRVLLSYSFKDFDIDNKCLSELIYSDYGRPSISKGIDFNISHSGNFVGCVCSNNSIVGIDIEQLYQNNLSGLETILSEDEWSTISKSEDINRELLIYWTKKEAIAKADGRGLNIPLKDIILVGDEGWLYGVQWFVRRIDLDHRCIVYIASKIIIPTTLSIEKINIPNLFNFNYIQTLLNKVL